MEGAYLIAIKGDNGEFQIQRSEDNPKKYGKREALSWMESLIKLNGASNVILLQEIIFNVTIDVTIEKED